MSYHFTYGSEVENLSNQKARVTTYHTEYDSDGNFLHDDDELELAETTSLDLAERASIQKLYQNNKNARVNFPPSMLLKKNLTLPTHEITLHLIAEVNRLLPYPGPIFRLSPPSRAEFIYDLTKLPILPSLEYFAQYSTGDLSDLYKALIDQF